MDRRSKLQNMYPDVPLLFMTEDEYDDAIMGVAEQACGEPTVAYDYDKVIKVNIKMGMTEDEAVEYFTYNQIGAYVGKQTPVFITQLEKDEKDERE